MTLGVALARAGASDRGTGIRHQDPNQLRELDFEMPPLPGGSFLGRVASWVVNELVVDSLANNKAFQRFAVRTAKAAEEIAEHGTCD